MRLTRILFGTNRGIDLKRLAKIHWEVARVRTIPIANSIKNLEALNIPIYEIDEVIRPALDEQTFIPPPVEPRKIREILPNAFSITSKFSPLAGYEFDQSQLITNSVIFQKLPTQVEEKLKPPTEDDISFMTESLIHSYLLDAQQEKLQYVLKYPGYRGPRDFGIYKDRKMRTLIHKLFMNCIQNESSEMMHVFENTGTRVTVSHEEHKKHFDYEVSLLLGGQKPIDIDLSMDPFMAEDPLPREDETDTEEDKAEAEQRRMPDMWPLSPFIHSKSIESYDDTPAFGLPNGVVPHTIFLNDLKHPNERSDVAFEAMGLVFSYGFMSAYAKQLYKDCTGVLPRPIAVNCVVMKEDMFHIGRFQLNTLASEGPLRNAYWSHPAIKLYNTLGYEEAIPTVIGLDAKLVSLLRAFF